MYGGVPMEILCDHDCLLPAVMAALDALTAMSTSAGGRLMLAIEVTALPGGHTYNVSIGMPSEVSGKGERS